MPRRHTPLTETTYTGLSDTAQGFTGESTLDQSVVVGSQLQLAGVDAASPSTDTSEWSSYDCIETQNPAESLNLSGVSDPPFQSAQWSNPNHGNANPPGPSAWNALNMSAKFGSAFGTLMGNHPETFSGQTGNVPRSRAKVPAHHAATGPSTIILLAVVAGLFLLLARAK
jgi:hypothetical protein